MNRLVENKTGDIFRITQEKKRHGEENMKGFTQLILEKEKMEEDHARVVLKLSSESEAEVSKLGQAMLLVKEELEGREKVCRDLERKVIVRRQGWKRRRRNIRKYDEDDFR